MVDRREDPVDFEGLEGSSASNDGCERDAQFGNIPRSSAELMELEANHVLWRNGELVAKGTVHEADVQIGIEYDEALPDRLDKIPRVNINVGHRMAPAHLLTTGSTSTISSEAPDALPIMTWLGRAVGNVHYLTMRHLLVVCPGKVEGGRGR